jgi:hypothetical protein
MRAKAPVIGEDVNDYRRDLAVQGKRLLPESHKLRAVQYRSLKADAYEVLEPQLLKAVAEYGNRNDSVPFDAPLREVHERGRNGEHTIRFLGQRHFVEQFKAAGLAGVSRRKFVHTTVKGSGRQAPDLVDRNFTAKRPNLLWVADIT